MSGLRVVEIGRHRSGAYAGLILAGLGAEVCVVPVEDVPTEDAEVRAIREAESVYFNRGKLELGGVHNLAQLVACADLLITDFSPQELREGGLPTSETEVERFGPSLVHVAITSFGLTGPHADYAMEDITDWAAGGIAAMTRAISHAEGAPRSPLLPPGRQPEMLAGIAGGIGALAGWRESHATGQAVLVDVSRVEVQAAMSHHSFPAWIWSNDVLGSQGSPLAEIGMFLQASDGPVYIRAVEDRQWLALAELAGVPTEIATERVNGMLLHQRNPGLVRELLAPWVASNPADWLVALGQNNRIPLAEPHTATDVLESAQLDERGAWRTVEFTGTQVRVPAVPLIEPGTRVASKKVTQANLESRWKR